MVEGTNHGGSGQDTRVSFYERENFQIAFLHQLSTC